MTTGEKIALLRTNKGLSQEDLAAELNVSRQTVYKWENDIALPKKEYLKQLVDLFATNFDYLLDEDYVEEESVKSEPEVVVINNPVSQPSVIPLATCDKCKKIITDENDLVRIQGVTNLKGRTSPDQVYCASCHTIVMDGYKKADELRAKQQKKDKDSLKRIARRDFWISLILGLAVLGLILGFGLSAILPNPDPDTLWLVIGSAVLGFFFVNCLFLRNNAAASIFGTISSWSVKFPGLIFTLDIDGIIWVILVKILFGIISVLISIVMFFVGLAIASLVSVVIYPFALFKNFSDPDDKENFFLQFISED